MRGRGMRGGGMRVGCMRHSSCMVAPAWCTCPLQACSVLLHGDVMQGGDLPYRAPVPGLRFGPAVDDESPEEIAGRSTHPRCLVAVPLAAAQYVLAAPMSNRMTSYVVCRPCPTLHRIEFSRV